MQRQTYSFNALFAQLGMDDSDAAVDHFIRANGPLEPTLHISDAPCWTPAQAKMLKEAIMVDAEWCEVVDQLDALLRKE